MKIALAQHMSPSTQMVVLRFEDLEQITVIDSSSPPDWYLAWLEEGNEPLPSEEEAPITWDDIRAKRDQLIRESDWTMIPGATVDQLAWSTYRQILRDLPQTYEKTGPESVVWPEPPSTSGPNTTPVE